MKILILLLLSGFTAFGQSAGTITIAIYEGTDRIQNKGVILPGIWPYKCTVSHKDGVCPWDVASPGIKVTIDTGKIENVWLICSLKSKVSSVFSSPAILVQGVYLIRRRPGKYVPVPKTWKILTVIK